jgi:NAD(P)-dependent dehydrogenase (short-subunit alcohol dehydrogenase family)
VGTASVVLVTNVGQGFGRAVALACGQGGHDVVCADRDVDLASKTAAEIEELGGQAIPIQADMTTHMDVLNTFHKVYEIFGDLNGVVHVAAYGSHTAFHSLGEGEFMELLEEDVKSSYLTLKVCAQVLREGWLVLVAPPESADEPQMTAVRAALSGLIAGFGDRYERLRANLLIPSRAASDPRHDAALIDSVLYLGSAHSQGIRGQQLYVELPPPPRVVESLLPEVQAALDSNVRQDDLEASLYYDAAETAGDGAGDGADVDGSEEGPGESEFEDEVAFPRELPG